MIDLTTVANLRNHSRREIREAALVFNDESLLKIYQEYQQSEDFGNNDEKFSTWLTDIREKTSEVVARLNHFITGWCLCSPVVRDHTRVWLEMSDTDDPRETKVIQKFLNELDEAQQPDE